MMRPVLTGAGLLAALLLGAVGLLSATAGEKPVRPEEPAGASPPAACLRDPVTGMEFVFVAGGEFPLADPLGLPTGEEYPLRGVVGDFFIGTTEVTQAQWEAVMGYNPSAFPGPGRPVENVAEEEIGEFVRRLSAKSGVPYRLPTEEEWEFAARSRGGDDQWSGTGEEAKVHDFAWFGREGTEEAGKKKPNRLGLYDMSGNVWELCTPSAAGAETSGRTPSGRLTIRGGGWRDKARQGRIGLRFRLRPGHASWTVGFRLALGGPESERRPVAGGRQSLPPADYVEPHTGMEFVFVPGGTFVMKDTMGFTGVTKPGMMAVRLSNFFIGRYEVTQAEWERVMGENPSRVRGGRWPVQGISWLEAEEFARRLGRMTGERFRLPTEAEWEYAARKRGGDDPWPGTADGSRVGEYAWHGKNSGGLPHRVGTKQPNGLGLFDLAGNMREWCRDLFGPYPDSPKENPSGAAEGNQRALRGGSWSTGRLRTTDRDSADPSRREADVGLRLVREVPPP